MRVKASGAPQSGKRGVNIYSAVREQRTANDDGFTAQKLTHITRNAMPFPKVSRTYVYSPPEYGNIKPSSMKQTPTEKNTPFLFDHNTTQRSAHKT